ncbi:TIM barrel protein [bacterium]|nr:TIM barrel protein [bacterium]
MEAFFIQGMDCGAFLLNSVMERDSIPYYWSVNVALETNLLGIVHAVLFPGPGNTSALMRGEAPKKYVLDSLQWIVENPHFQSIEITRVKSGSIRREAIQLLQTAKQEGKIKEIVFSAQPVQLINEDNIVEPSDICSLDEHERAKAVHRLKECIDEAREFGCDKFAFLSGKDPAIMLEQSGEEAEITRSQALAQLRRSVDEVCRYIKEDAAPMMPLMEVFDYRKNPEGTGFFKECLIGPAERAETFVESVRNFYGHQEFALMIDTSHMLIAGEGPEVLKRISSCIGHIHIANVVLNRNNPGGDARYGDMHPAMHAADSELTETVLAGYLRALNECNYQGTLGFEIKPIGSEIPEDLADNAVQFLYGCRNSIHVNYALINNYIYQSRRFLTEDLWDKLGEIRINQPGLIKERMKARQQRETLAPDGKLVILAADHPARMVTNVGEKPAAMGDRFEYLGRCARVLMASRVDGLMGTADIIEDLILLDSFYQEKAGASFLDKKVLIACMNRGGLAGAKYEMFDRQTAYRDIKKVKELNLDGAKMLLRLAIPDQYDRYSIQTMEECSRVVEACNEYDVPAFLEPLPVQRVDGQYKVVMQADDLIKAIGVAAGLSSSSANMWMKIPYVSGYDRVAQSFSGPILMLGGASTGYPVDVIEQFACGMGEGENVRGAMVGRNVLFPGDDDPAAVAESICTIVHQGLSANEAVKKIPSIRGTQMDLLPRE